MNEKKSSIYDIYLGRLLYKVPGIELLLELIDEVILIIVVTLKMDLSISLLFRELMYLF